MKTILSIIPFALTSKDFFEIRSSMKELSNYHFFKNLPEWCIRADNGLIDYTASYHYFSGQIEENNEKLYYLLNIEPVDNILKEEISNVGVDGMFEGYDWRPLFKKIRVNDSPHKGLKIPMNVHVIVDLVYIRDDDDWDLTVDVMGFLDSSMDLYRI